MSAGTAYKILVVGNSYVYRLNCFVETSHPWGFADLIVNGSQCEFSFHGVRDATVDTFLAADMCAPILAARPDAVCLFLGENDLDSQAASTPVMVALDIHRLASRLLASGVKCVCVGQVCCRQQFQTCEYSVGASRVQELNTYLRAFSEDTDGVFFWRHKSLGACNRIHQLFGPDGVQFNNLGNYRFFRSVRGAIMTAVRRLQSLDRIAA